MRLIDADLFLEETSKDPLFPLVERYGLSHVIKAQPTVDAIPIGFIDQVIDEYTHLVECYLYEDNEDYKTMLYYRNALNDLKRRWKRDRPKLRI